MNLDFSKVPGDLGDSRFNNYILEHGYNYFTGKTAHYWNGLFMYPYKNTIALSDNLLGTLPIYSFFRFFGSDRETAFQWWFLALFILNFICCFWALNKWVNHPILASVGSYIFVFSLCNIGQLNHAQVFPKFMVPLVFYWSWKYLFEKKIKYFLLLVFGVVYQFYCGMYLGFLLLYVLLFFFIAYWIVYRDRNFFSQFKATKTVLWHVAIILFGIVLLLPLTFPYLEVAHTLGTRHFENVVSSLPRLRSYFFAFPSAVLWKFLYFHSAYAFEGWFNHFLFTGALPWIGILISPFLLFSGKTKKENKKLILVILLGCFLSVIFCLNINGFTLYRIIYLLPGFSSMRSLDRVINTEIMYFVLITVFAYKTLSEHRKIIKWLVLLLPVFGVVDNLFTPWIWDVKSYEKRDSQEQISIVKKTIQSQYNPTYASIAFIPDSVAEERSYGDIVTIHLNVMLATQELNIPCVNAYTAFEPGNFADFFFNINNTALQNWCNFNHIDCNTILKVYENTNN